MAEEDDFSLMLSQSMHDASQDDDDMRLFLSQSQPRVRRSLNESTMSDVTESAASVKLDVQRIEAIIKLNQKSMLAQNKVVMELVANISVTVSEISDRLVVVENKLRTLNTIAINNNEQISELKKDSANKMKKQQDRILQIENRLNNIENKRSTPSTSGNNGNEIALQENNIDSKNENSVIILNFPYGQKDREDVDELINRGLGLNIRAKSVHRAPSKDYNAGVLTIELSSQDDKAALIRNKYKLRRNECYSNVYIDVLTHTEIFRLKTVFTY